MYKSVNNKRGNKCYFTSERQDSLTNEVKEAKRVKENQTVHYRWLKRCQQMLKRERGSQGLEVQGK